MRVRRIFTYWFDKGDYPILFWGLIGVFLLINDRLNIHFVKKPLALLYDISLLSLLFSFFYQLYHRVYLKGFATLFLLFAAIFFSFMKIIVEGDHWADDLKIPTHIPIANPIDMDGYGRPDSIFNLIKNQTDLVLYNSNQPGMYEYDFWTGKISDGTIYLKAFEITQEEELSSDNLKENSRVSISNVSDRIERIGSTTYFTIYEGDWGKYYAARFEVWFKPALGGQEKKLFQKNFKIQGWMH